MSENNTQPAAKQQLTLFGVPLGELTRKVASIPYYQAKREQVIDKKTGKKRSVVVKDDDDNVVPLTTADGSKVVRAYVVKSIPLSSKEEDVNTFKATLNLTGAAARVAKREQDDAILDSAIAHLTLARAQGSLTAKSIRVAKDGAITLATRSTQPIPRIEKLQDEELVAEMERRGYKVKTAKK